MKRLFDVIVSFLILLVFSPILIVVCLLIYLQDYHNPLYIASRVGRRGRLFQMYKLRSMIVNADKSGVDSTANDDRRITKIGTFVRRYKLDELAQLFNVLKGDMSLVGPRPNVKNETDLYTSLERTLLSVRPGITDLSSIVYSDEGDILEGQSDPDLAYNQLIRPGKGYLGLFYVKNRSISLDLRILFITALAIINKTAALDAVVKILREQDASEQLIKIASRQHKLEPTPPPGAKNIVTDRNSIPH